MSLSMPWSHVADRSAAASPEAPARELMALLYGQLRRLAGPRPDLDDLVQAALERALRAWPRFEGRSALSTFTYSIAYHTFVDHERWFRRLERRFLALDAIVHEPPHPTPDAEILTGLAARARCLRRALDRLPPAKRAVVVLHELEGVALAEVAAIVGTNERTVRSRLHDARAKLVALLRADPEFVEETAP